MHDRNNELHFFKNLFMYLCRFVRKTNFKTLMIWNMNEDHRNEKPIINQTGSCESRVPMAPGYRFNLQCYLKTDA